jgi:hypothetical protein
VHWPSALLALLACACACASLGDSAGRALDIAAECAPDHQYVIQGLSSILAGEDAFAVLDRIKREKGAELVLCAVQRFLDRVAVSPETAKQRATARAYLDRP